jgi:hypothetical protein
LRVIVFPSVVVIGDFYVSGIAVLPLEANAILFVDPDGVLAFAILAEGVQLVFWWHFQVSQFLCGGQHSKFTSGDFHNVGWEAFWAYAVKYRLGGFVPEAADHSSNVSSSDTFHNLFGKGGRLSPQRFQVKVAA